MGSHRLVSRPLVVAAALGLALPGVSGVGAPPAAAQTCPPPAALATRSDGTLWEYTGNGTGGWAGQFQIGAGWNALTLTAGVG